MGARFAQGVSTASTRTTAQMGRVPISRGAGRAKAGGMPGYIKTTQTKSSAGLTNPSKARGGNLGHFSGPTDIPVRKGEPRRNWQAAPAVNGSSDKSYRATSTGSPGTIRPTTGPMKPAKRTESESEGPSRGAFGRKGAVAAGGTYGANKFPAGGIGQGKPSGHATLSGGKGSANVSGQKFASGLKSWNPKGGAKGTMESLAGKGSYRKSGQITSRRKSMMY